MKKLVCLLAVALMAAPVMAGSVAVTVDDTTTAGQAVITLTGDAGIVGIGLEVSCTEGVIDDLAIDSFFDVFIDFAHSEIKDGDGYDYGEGSAEGKNAAAQVAVAGKLALPAAEFAICAGGLDDDPDTTADDAPLTATVTLIATANAAGTISLNPERGGIVDAGGAMTVTGLPANFNITVGPTCCPGDVTGDGLITYSDIQALFDIGLGNADWATVNPCADQTGDGLLTYSDVQFIFDLGLGGTCP